MNKEKVKIFSKCIEKLFTSIICVALRWVLASKATVTTMTSSFGGGTAGIIGCYLIWKGKMKVPYIVNSVFASLISITGEP